MSAVCECDDYFEMVELEESPEARRAWLTSVVIGAGLIDVELAGALAEIAGRTTLALVDYRRRLAVLWDWGWAYFTWSRRARVILEVPQLLEPVAAAKVIRRRTGGHGAKLSAATQPAPQSMQPTHD